MCSSTLSNAKTKHDVVVVGIGRMALLHLGKTIKSIFGTWHMMESVLSDGRDVESPLSLAQSTT